MSRKPELAEQTRRMWMLALALCLGLAGAALAPPALIAQQPAGAAQSPAGPQVQAPAAPSPGQKSRTANHITPEQAQQLFGLVDDLLKFSSQETGLPIKNAIKRQLTTRAAIESYLKEKFSEDEDAKRMQRSEIVLKKFGMLDRDFDLKPFLLSLLKEQIEAYYDPKTKTVNLLDWVSADEQKPVLAHELTHALQDQHVDMGKWSDQTPPDVSVNSSGDTEHLAKDELDTARNAVAEGQAIAVMMDSILKPMGHSLIQDPEVVELIKQQMTGSSDSPILARAPLLLSESLLFPYREGLSFEQDVWMDKGQTAAFSGALDHPPTSSWEIMNPRAYEKGETPPVPLLPDIHPLVDKLYQPYDIGQVGQLDLHILAGIFGGEEAARNVTPAWDGGIYWAGQLRNASPAEQASTKSIALLYLSAWKNTASAQGFARLYTRELGRKYSGLKPDMAAQSTAPTSNGEAEQVFSTDEGPVVITTRGKMVFVTESFPLSLARRLAALILDAQGTGAMQQAKQPGGSSDTALAAASTLSGGLVHLFAHCGVMKSVVDAERIAAYRAQ